MPSSRADAGLPGRRVSRFGDDVPRGPVLAGTPVIPVLMIGVGGYLLYEAIKGNTLAGAKTKAIAAAKGG